jgi:hypothetical protein
MVPAKAPKRAARRGVATCSTTQREARRNLFLLTRRLSTKTSRAPSRSSVASKQPHTVRYAYHDY